MLSFGREFHVYFVVVFSALALGVGFRPAAFSHSFHRLDDGLVLGTELQKDKGDRLPYLCARTYEKELATTPSSPDIGTLGRHTSRGKVASPHQGQE